MSNIVINPKSSTYIFNKSKFIAFIYYVENLDEIQFHLKNVKSKYADAKHIIYAYRLNQQNMKCDEDKEPSNTCAKPILSFLCQKDYINTLVIVVRYFGGILLGTGNLKHAYMEPFFECLNNNTTIYIPHYKYELIFNYNQLGYINNWIEKTNSKIITTSYLENKIIYTINTTCSPHDIKLNHQIKFIKI